MDYLPYRRTNRGITFIINIGFAQYEIFCANVCDIWQEWNAFTVDCMLQLRQKKNRFRYQKSLNSDVQEFSHGGKSSHGNRKPIK